MTKKRAAKRSVVRSKDFKNLLERTKGERDAHSWLEANPDVVPGGIGTVGSGMYVASEFQLGSRYRVDFITLVPFSGGWEIHFVELEAVDARLYTSKKTPSASLARGLTQVEEWDGYFKQNMPQVLRDLSDFMTNNNLRSGNVIKEGIPRDNTGWHLFDPRACLVINYHVVIGRRSAVSDEERERVKSKVGMNQNVRIRSYDAFTDWLENCELVEASRRK
jgi:hypothetical protein